MDLVSDCKSKLAQFRVTELKYVLGRLGLVKQGRKQELMDRILSLLSGDAALSICDLTMGKINGKQGVANIIDDTYRKMLSPGASNLATDGQSGYNVGSMSRERKLRDSVMEKKVSCPCGSPFPTENMVECSDPNCHVLQHVLCVIIPEESQEDVPPAPPQFYCEVCRINRADPFWVGVRNLLSPVKLVLSDIPVDNSSSLQNLDKEFEITSADRCLLKNAGYEVQVWCILLNDTVPFRIQWPQFCNLKINGIPVMMVNRSGSQFLGPNGRDDGAIVSSVLGEGFNKISLVGADPRRFCLGVRLIKRRSTRQVLSLIPGEQEGEPLPNALVRVCRCISGGMASAEEDSDSDLEVIADSVTVNLRCPMSGSRMKTASRFKSCLHMGCFDLETYVEINKRTRKWQCPICLKNYSFKDIIIDPYFNRITKLIGESGADVTEIDVKANGSWRAKLGYAFLDLEQWHLPDGSLCVSENEVTTSPMKGIEGNSNTVVVEHENASGEYFGNSNKNVKTMSSGSGSIMAQRSHSINKRETEVSSQSYNFGSASGITNRSSCASFGDPGIILLSDSDEECELGSSVTCPVNDVKNSLAPSPGTHDTSSGVVP